VTVLELFFVATWILRVRRISLCGRLCALIYYAVIFCRFCRSQWPRGQRHELSSLARNLGSWV
jgi:hypothetical protein